MSMKEIIGLDAQLSEKLRLEPGQPAVWSLMVFFAHSGDSWFWVAGLGIVWLLARNPWHARAALMAVAVVGLAVLVLAIKFMVKRRRPEGEWGAIYRNTDPHSFPSGHAARAFLLVILAAGLGPGWFALLLLVWAPLVCLARVATGVHYLSDVVAGMLLGILAGWVVLLAQPIFYRLLQFLF